MPLSKTGQKAIGIRERDRRALEMRKAGLTYDEIARELGFSRNAAWKSVMRSLTALTREPAESVRRLELTRLDTLQRRLWLNAKQGNAGAIDRILKIMERRAKILGLDAADKHEVTTRGTVAISVTARSAMESKLDDLRKRLLGGAGEPGGNPGTGSDSSG